MKKIFLMCAVIVAAVLTGCNQVSKEQYQQVTNTNDSLMYVALQQGNEIYELSTTLKSVSEELDQINGQLEISNGEDQSLLDKRNRLMQKLAMVKRTLDEKQQALDELQKKYSAQLGQNKELKKTIDRLQSQVTSYEGTIANYKIQVAEQSEQIAELTDTLSQTLEALEETVAQSEMQQEVINTQDKMLNTGYYIVADKAKLMDLGLLEGGVFSRKRLTTQGFTHEGFTQVDIREVSEIMLGSKKVDIMTTHPSDSYSLETLADGRLKLVIKDQTAFWKNSRFLVAKTR